MERSEEMKQDRRLKPIQGDHNQQPQKCPRCESINTKFCYYNNYSLSQPRYFCKTCRRYWTHGGTLRNVPVGGGCRKGKRLKTSAAAAPSSGENSRSQSQPQQLINLGTNYSASAANTALVGLSSTNKESDTNFVPPSIGSFYPAGGFLNSLAAIQSLSNNPTNQSFPLNHHHQQQQQPVNHLDLGGGTTSNLNLLNGFNAIAPFGSNQQRQFYQMGNLPHQQQNWQQHSFINSSSSNAIIADTSLWSISTSTTAAANNNGGNTTASAASFPLNPNDNHWHDLSGYTSPPP